MMRSSATGWKRSCGLLSCSRQISGSCIGPVGGWANTTTNATVLGCCCGSWGGIGVVEVVACRVPHEIFIVCQPRERWAAGWWWCCFGWYCCGGSYTNVTSICSCCWWWRQVSTCGNCNLWRKAIVEKHIYILLGFTMYITQTCG